MGHILSLLTYYFRFRSDTRVPVVLPVGYPGNKLPGYGSPTNERRKMLTKHHTFGSSQMYAFK